MVAAVSKACACDQPNITSANNCNFHRFNLSISRFGAVDRSTRYQRAVNLAAELVGLYLFDFNLEYERMEITSDNEVEQVANGNRCLLRFNQNGPVKERGLFAR